MTETDSFLNKEKLYERFNNSIEEYNKYLQERQNDGGGTLQYLDAAGSVLGALIEHVIKYIVYNDYAIKCKDGLSQSEIDHINAVMNFKNNRNKDLNTHEIFCILFEEHKNFLITKNMVPNRIDGYSLDQRAKIDDRNMRERLVNGFKHEGSVPNHEVFPNMYAEVRTLMNKLIDCDIPLKEISDVCYGTWDRLYTHMGYFQPDEQCYVLITGKLSEAELQNNLFRIPWSLIIDFDCETDKQGGLMQSYQLTNNCAPRISILSNIVQNEQLMKTHLVHWLLVGNPNDNSFNQMDDKMLKRRTVTRNIQKFLESFCEQYTKTISILVINCDNFVCSTKTILEAWDSVCDGENIRCNFLSGNESSEIYNLSYDYFLRYQMTTREFLQSIQNELKEPIKTSNSEYVMPGAKSADCKLSVSTYNEVLDMIEPIYLGIEENPNDPLANEIEQKKFYQGDQKISWHMLAKNIDLQREIYSRDNERIIRDVWNRGAHTPLLKLEYEAGVGATTYLRRLAYNLHKEIPTVFVHQFIAQYTMSSLHKVYQCCQQPLLILIDGNEVFSDQLNALHQEIYTDKFPCVIVYAVRKRQQTNQQLLLPRLSKIKGEVDAMCELLLPYIPQTQEGIKQKKQLDKCAAFSEKNLNHIPFILSLYAFNKDFHGIREFVQNTLQEAKMIKEYEENLQILFDIALADYADLRLPNEYFDEVISNGGANALKKSGYIWSPLISIDDESIHMKHLLFSETILKILSNTKDNISFLILKPRLLKFISDSHKNQHQQASRAIVNMLRNMFITREQDTEFYNAKYSKLITTIQHECSSYLTDSIQEIQRVITEVFETLVKTYPQIPHFYGHLARYYFYELKDFDKGFKTIKLGIRVAEGNNVNQSTLYHIEGMGYVIQQNVLCFEKIKKIKNEKFSSDILDELKQLYQETNNLIDNAATCFKKSIEEGEEGIYPQVAECNMRIDVHQHLYLEVNKICAKNQAPSICEPDILQYNLDMIDCLIDEAKETVNDYDSTLGKKQEELIDELVKNRNLLNKNNEETISLCREYLESSNINCIPIYRRRLVRAYWAEIENKHITSEKQDILKEIIRYMEGNISIEPKKTSNYRLWFHAMRELVTSDEIVEKNLNDILYKLNIWIATEDAPGEAYYYRFVTKFIILFETGRMEVAAEKNELLEDLDAMKRHGGLLRKRTMVRDWMGKKGRGLNRLIKDSDFRQMKHQNKFIDMLEEFTGRLPGPSEFGRTSYLNLERLQVFFRPIQIQDRIGIANANQSVDLCIGFSYDGIRAYPESIRLSIVNPINEKIINEKPILAKAGDLCYLCVDGHNKSMVYGTLSDVNKSIGVLEWKDTESGSNCQMAGYSLDEWPNIGEKIKIRLLKERQWNNSTAWQVQVDIWTE